MKAFVKYLHFRCTQFDDEVKSICTAGIAKGKKNDQITESRSFSGKLKTMQFKKKKNAKVKTLGIKKN